MIVYKATNLINNKVYIGQTIYDLNSRRKSHTKQSSLKNGNNYFKNAINKYGVDEFKWEVIRICNNVNELNVWEQYYILYYNSINDGYNLQSGGLNYIASESTKEKQSKSQEKCSYEKTLNGEQKWL